MKKYLIVLAATAMLFVSCGDKKVKITGMSFKDTQVELMLGDTTRLALRVEPAEVTLPAEDITWESSDTLVVRIVDTKGNITAVGSGEANVTASYGEYKAVCKVIASSYEEAWSPDWLYYFSSSKQLVSEQVIEMDGGYKCQLYAVRFFIPSPLDFDEEGTGEGYAIWATGVIPFICEGENKDKMYARALAFTADASKLLNPFAAQAGGIDPKVVGPACQNYLVSYAAGAPALSDDDKAALQNGNYGAGIYYTWSDDDGVAPTFFCSGIVNEGGYMQMKADEDGNGYVDYDFSAQWDYWGFLNCLNVDPQEEDITKALIQPYELALSKPIHYVTGQKGVMSAPARMKSKMPKTFMSKKMEKPVRVTIAPIQAAK